MPALRAAQALADGATLDQLFPGFRFASCTPIPDRGRACTAG